MSTTSPRAPLFSAAKLRGDFFPWVLAVVTGLDYFDNSIFSFFTSHIAGGINASPDELVWASSAYAVAAVLGILQQQWWSNASATGATWPAACCSIRLARWPRHG
jgi:hypothetical protein